MSDALSDEEGGAVKEARSVVIRGTKAEVLAITSFLTAVSDHLEAADHCHMHLRDNMPGWSKAEHFDIEISVDERAD